ncbi:FAD-binding oxidoreductase [uncultured Aureimonas sp.]|uniref:NAD(P)/FAD-dependent oxidoreductase n=1 Tax=uncultured Aureimonas sp. TaxID=1604662 RepID=UPI0025DC595A|nr:FAD-binding oxidoreductase [uncultured Aureimonas sp.]
MGPHLDFVPGDTVVPRKVDFVIVGGGVIGASAAMSLVEAGHSVVLCEKGQVAGEQSSRNWGWCRQAGRDEREVPLIVESLRLWRGMNERVGAETGFRQHGTLYVADSPEEEASFEAWARMARPQGVDAEILTGARLAEVTGGAPLRHDAGLFVASDGRAEPQLAVPAMVRVAKGRGLTVLAPCAVTGVERSGGRVDAVMTEYGRIECSGVLVAAGAWSSAFCRGLGLRLPQLKVLGSVFRTSAIEGGPEASIWIGKIGLRKRLDGGYTIAHSATYDTPLTPDSVRFLREFMPMLRAEARGVRPHLALRSFRELLTPQSYAGARMLDPPPRAGDGQALLGTLASLFPAFAEARILQRWGGYIDVTPDVVPYIDRIAADPNVVVATGFSGHGFGIGPGAGLLAAQLLMGREPMVGTRDFELRRFSDGRGVRLGAEV